MTKIKIKSFSRKKYFSVASIILGTLFLLFLLLNFGFNLWLKYQLPEYIKKNTDYQVRYKKLDVHLGTGSILVTDFNIKSENTHSEKVRINGHIDTVAVSRLGIYQFIFSKILSVEDVKLSKPTIEIILAKPQPKKKSQKNPFEFSNLTISDGDIKITQQTGQKLLSIKNLHLETENLKLNTAENHQGLPFSLDSYSISATNLFYRASAIYAFTAKKLSTENNQLKLLSPELVPLVTVKNAQRFFPKQMSLFAFKAEEVWAQDILFSDNKLGLKQAFLDQPKIKVYETGAAKTEKKAQKIPSFNFDQVSVAQLQLEILKPDGTPGFSVANVNAKIDQFKLNEELSKSGALFGFENYNVNGEALHLKTNSESISANRFEISPKNAGLHKIALKSHHDETKFNISSILINFNEWSFKNKQLQFDIDKILIDQPNGKLAANSSKMKKISTSSSSVLLPVKVNLLQIKNGSLVYEKNASPIAISGFNANFHQIKLSDFNKEKPKIAVEKYSIDAEALHYKMKFYNLSAARLKLSESAFQLSSFSMLPTVSRTAFVKMIPTEKDLYTLKANKISAQGKWDFWSGKTSVFPSQITIDGADANIFRSKIPKDDLSEKPLYSKLLRNLKFPLFIDDLYLKNSILVYEEDTKKSDGPGKLVFSDFNLHAKNLNSVVKGKPTEIPIQINCRFMDASPMNVRWVMNTAKPHDDFTIAGNITNLSAPRINPFIEPYLKIRATGEISALHFDFKGNNRGLDGSLNMKRKDLKVSLLKQSGEKNKFLSAVVNVFVKSNSGQHPESVQVQNVERDPTRSFFNLFWKGIEQGLKRTLLGKNEPEKEVAVKAKIENTKTTINNTKSEIKEVKKEVVEKVENIKEKGIMKKVFKKKSDSN